jgi:glycosyltransferase involved in cell wall biosynthesis
LLADKRGIVIPIKDSPAIAKAIVLLAEDAALRKLISENARKWVVNNHSLQALKQSITSLVVS